MSSQTFYDQTDESGVANRDKLAQHQYISEDSSTAFVEFMLDRIDEVLDRLIAQEHGGSQTEQVKRSLAAMEYDTPYNAAALMRLLGLKCRDALRNNYLNPAIEESLIQMILPDLVVPMSEHRTFKYFREETLEAAVAKYGWTLIDNFNRKAMFMDMVRSMDMS